MWDMTDRQKRKLEIKIELVKMVQEREILDNKREYKIMYEEMDPYEPEVEELLEKWEQMGEEINNLKQELIELDSYKTDNKEDLDYIKKDDDLFLRLLNLN